MLFETLISHPSDTIALRDGETVLHYGDLMTEIEKRVEKLSEVKVLGLALDNSVEWALWDLAALKAEIPCVPLPLPGAPRMRKVRKRSGLVSSDMS